MKCMLCQAEYPEGMQHYCPNVRVSFNGIPYKTPWYVCPNCGGGFFNWDWDDGVEKCPFCGMVKGKYPVKLPREV